jgi:hypothetical protein
MEGGHCCYKFWSPIVKRLRFRIFRGRKMCMFLLKKKEEFILLSVYSIKLSMDW